MKDNKGCRNRIVTVDALEMTAIDRPVGMAVCDGCGKRIKISTPGSARGTSLDSLRRRGWKIDTNKVGSRARCAQCVRKGVAIRIG